MQTVQDANPAVMAKGGSEPAGARAAGAATFRLVEGATLELPDGCSVTVRQGALQLPDGQRLPLPQSGGSVTIERRVLRPDGRTALVRHTIRLGEVPGQAAASQPLPTQNATEESPPPETEGSPSLAIQESASPGSTPDKSQGLGSSEDSQPPDSAAEDGRFPDSTTGDIQAPSSAPEDNQSSESKSEDIQAPSSAPDDNQPSGLAPDDSRSPSSANEDRQSPSSANEDSQSLSPANEDSRSPSSANEDNKSPDSVSGDVSVSPGSTAEESQIPSSASEDSPHPSSACMEYPGSVHKDSQSLSSAYEDSQAPSSAQEGGQPSSSAPEEDPSAVPGHEDNLPSVPDREDSQVRHPASEDSQVPHPASEDSQVPHPASKDSQFHGATPKDSQLPNSIIEDGQLRSSAPEDSQPPRPALENGHSSVPAPDDGQSSSSAREDIHQTPIAAPGDRQPPNSAHENEQSSEPAPENSRPAGSATDDRSPRSAPEYSLSPGSPTRSSQPLSPVIEVSEPSFEDAALKLETTSHPYCEWAESHKDENAGEQSVHADSGGTESFPHDCDPHPSGSQTKVTDTYDHCSVQLQRNDSNSEGCQSTSPDETREPTGNKRLAHHGSLTLPIAVPRLRNHDNGVNARIANIQKHAGEKSGAQKTQEEDDAMRLKLNSILRRLGYGASEEGADVSNEDASDKPDGVESAKPQETEANQGPLEGPEEPEPVSVPKVISYFESITPQRVESPVERRKLHSSARSPSALRSPRSARTPEPSRDQVQGQDRASPRRVNFADSAMRVYISNSEPDEMEDIPIPQQGESSPQTSPDDIQGSLKEIESVITRQPTRLTVIPVQNSPKDGDGAPEAPKAADGALEAPNATDETPEAPTTADKVPGTPTNPEEYGTDRVADSLSEPQIQPEHTQIPANSPDTSDPTKPSTPDQEEDKTVAQSQVGKQEEALELADSPAPEEKAPIASAAGEDSDQGPEPEESPSPAADPVQAEPLSRPSCVTVHSDLPDGDLPASLPVDPTERVDGQTTQLLIAAEGPEDDACAEPSDPFLPEDAAERGVVTKPSSWFEECMDICCCCWAP